MGYKQSGIYKSHLSKQLARWGSAVHSMLQLSPKGGSLHREIPRQGGFICWVQQASELLMYKGLPVAVVALAQ